MKKQSLEILRKILVILTLATISLSFTPRTRCSANKLTFTKKFIAYYLNSFRDTTFFKTASNFSDIINYQVYHYGHSLNYSEKNLQVPPDCKNFFVSNTSCCTSQDINDFQIYFKKVFQFLFKAPQKVKYPSFSYFFTLIKKINSKPECLVNGKLDLPGVNGSTYTSSPQSIASLVQQHDQILREIYEYQWQFIKNSICVFCLGTKDYSKFLNPFASKYPKSSQESYDQIIYNQNYFKLKVNFLKSKLTVLAQLTQQLINIFKGNYTFTYIKNTCSDLQNQIRDQTKWDNYIVCKNAQTCELFAIEFFGGVGCPQILRIFDVISNGGRLLNRGPISISKTSGFKGNVTYENDKGALNDVKQYFQYTVLAKEIFA